MIVVWPSSRRSGGDVQRAVEHHFGGGGTRALQSAAGSEQEAKRPKVRGTMSLVPVNHFTLPQAWHVGIGDPYHVIHQTAVLR